MQELAVLPEPVLPAVSLIVPTFKERDNLPQLVERLNAVRAQHENFELIVVDDNSCDGTDLWVANQKTNWLKLIVRKNERGLSSAVLRGIKESSFPVICVMDADLSHPPEKIPEMVDTLVRQGCDFVIGSRYVRGGQIEGEWGIMRWLNSKVSTLLARPFTNARDPMSGFFCLYRSKFNEAKNLNPIGYKIGLEIIAKSNCQRIAEVPIKFSERYAGQSKLAEFKAHLREVTNYLRHIHRLAKFKYKYFYYFLRMSLLAFLGALLAYIST